MVEEILTNIFTFIASYFNFITVIEADFSKFLNQILSSSYFRLVLLLLPPSLAIVTVFLSFMTHQLRITALLIDRNFPSLSRKQINLISKRIRKVTFIKGSSIISQGDQAKECFILSKGGATVYANYAQVGQTKLAELKTGDLFGEMGLLEDKVRSASIIASENSECIKIDAETFFEFISGNSKDDRSQEALKIVHEIATNRKMINKAWLRFKD